MILELVLLGVDLILSSGSESQSIAVSVHKTSLKELEPISCSTDSQAADAAGYNRNLERTR